MLLGLVGLGAGFASSFLGIGGGLILVPSLTVFLHVPLKRAIGTSLGTIVIVAAAGVATEIGVKGENIHWIVALWLTVGALLGSWLGVRLMVRASVSVLRWSLVALLILSAARLWGLAAGGTSGALGASSGWLSALSSSALGLLSGVASSLFGIGGGIIAVPGLVFLFGDIPFHAARATSLVMIVPTSALGTVLQRRQEHVDLASVRALLPAAVCGAVAGSIAANRLSEGPLRAAFSAFLLYAAWRLARSRSV